MPNIIQYNGPDQGPRPDEGAMNTAREAGTVENRFIRQGASAIGQGISRGLGTIGAQVDAANNLQRVSAGAKALSGLTDSLTQQWNAAANGTDPNDTSIRQGFLDKNLEPSLENFTSQFDGDSQAVQNWAHDQANALRNHFRGATAADMASRASDALSSNVDAVTNNLSSAVFNDPSMFDVAKGMSSSTVDALIAHSPNLDPSVAGKARTTLADRVNKELAKSAILGTAERNPTAALEQIGSGKYDDFLSATEKQTLTGVVNQIQRYQTTQQRAAQAAQDKANHEAAQQAAGVATAKAYTADGQFVPNADTVTQFKNILLAPQGYEIGRAGLAAVDRATKDRVNGVTVQTDANTYNDFTQRMLSTDPNTLTAAEIYSARANGNLSDHDMKFILEARSRILSDPAVKAAHTQFSTFIKGERTAFTSTNIFGGRDPVGDQNFADFQRQALTKFNQVYNAKGDWQSLLNPKSKDYLGNLAQGYVGKGAAAPQATGYQPGQSYGGYVFKGGDWRDKTNWTKQ